MVLAVPQTGDAVVSLMYRRPAMLNFHNNPTVYLQKRPSLGFIGVSLVFMSISRSAAAPPAEPFGSKFFIKEFPAVRR